MEIQKIKVESDEKLSGIVHAISKGRLRLPPFQRDFVWERSKVVNLTPRGIVAMESNNES